jgi:hydrogenase expression/formation protein HypE
MSSNGRIMLAHGGGGQLTDDLLSELVLPRLGNDVLNELLDSATFDLPAGSVALTIDGYVVQPLEFPGGDIGRLCVSGTVNDLAVCGAEPLGLALGLVLSEGLERELLERVLDSIRRTADEAGVAVVTGDTKVVGRGQADGMYITTAGLGRRLPGRRLHPDQVRAGDLVILSGHIADHGLAVMLAREMPDVQSALQSDVAPLNGMVRGLLDAAPELRFMRDPTRGGLAGVLADLAERSGYHLAIDERQIPIRPETLHAAEMLGIDPLDVANEGKVVAVVGEASSSAALAALRSHPCGRHACIIGRVEPERDGICELQTPIGGRRILQKPYGEQLPRIC